MTTAASGLWTKKDLAEARGLVEACEASGAHWTFADWLLTKEPTGHRGHSSGTRLRLVALGEEIGLSFKTLDNMRRAADSWPSQYRVPAASFWVHARYTTGGRSQAKQRAEQLSASPRNRAGKIRSGATPGHQTSCWRSLNVHVDVHAAVVVEAEALGLGNGEVASELISEALAARAWLADEVAA